MVFTLYSHENFPLGIYCFVNNKADTHTFSGAPSSSGKLLRNVKKRRQKLKTYCSTLLLFQASFWKSYTIQVCYIIKKVWMQNSICLYIKIYVYLCNCIHLIFIPVNLYTFAYLCLHLFLSQNPYIFLTFITWHF